MIILTIVLEIILIVLGIVFAVLSADSYEHEVLMFVLSLVCWLTVLIMPIGIGELHGYINYAESNDKDKARLEFRNLY